jgi:predicted PurR-regulated permease PerM
MAHEHTQVTILSGDAAFVRRIFLGVAIIGLTIVLVMLADLMLLIVAAIILAVVLRAAAGPIGGLLHVGETWAVTIAASLILLALGLLGWLFGPQMVAQIQALFATLPGAWDKLSADLLETSWGAPIVDMVRDTGSYLGQFASQVPLFALGVAGVAANIVLGLVGGVMLAMEPRSYRNGFLLLFPSDLGLRIGRALDATGLALKGWLIAQLASMAVIGVLTSIGLMLAGVPSALGLGLFAGLAQFVPYVGPFISAIPGLLIAGATSFDVFIWAAVVYAGVQQVDDNLITPWIQKHIAGIPMALSLFSIVAFGVLFGPFGIVLATPLTLIALVMVRSLYIRDILGHNVPLPGDPKPAA